MAKKNFIIKTLSPITSLTGLSSLIKLTGKKIIIPVYHAVTDHPPAHLKHLYRIRSLKEFHNDVEDILKYFKPISIQELIDYVNSGPPPSGNYCHFTFDDGLREVYDHVYPYFKQKGIPCTIFLNPAFIDNQDLFYRYKVSLLLQHLEKNDPDDATNHWLENRLRKKNVIKKTIRKYIQNLRYNDIKTINELANRFSIDFKTYLKNQKPYLDQSQIKEMIDDGFTLGGHSIDHPDFHDLATEAQICEALGSTQKIQRLFNLNYKVFAFPFTDYGVKRTFFDHVFSEDRSSLDMSFGTAGIKDDQCNRNLQRISFEYLSNSALHILKTEYIYYMLRKAIRKHVIIRK